MNVKKILYRSFDSILSAEKDKKLKEGLLSSKELREEKNKLEKLRILLASIRSGKFKSEFENNVLRKIRLAKYPQIFFYREIQFAFKKFVIAAGLVIAFLVIYNFGEHGKINILSKEKIKLGEALYSEYLYSVEDLKEANNVE